MKKLFFIFLTSFSFIFAPDQGTQTDVFENVTVAGVKLLPREKTSEKVLNSRLQKKIVWRTSFLMAGAVAVLYYGAVKDLEAAAKVGAASFLALAPVAFLASRW